MFCDFPKLSYFSCKMTLTCRIYHSGVQTLLRVDQTLFKILCFTILIPFFFQPYPSPINDDDQRGYIAFSAYFVLPIFCKFLFSTKVEGYRKVVLFLMLKKVLDQFFPS